MAMYTVKELMDLANSNYKREIYSISYDEILKIKNDLSQYIVDYINEAYDLTDGKYEELRSDKNYIPPERLLIIENNLKNLNNINKYILEEEERRSNIRELSILDFNDKYQDRTKNTKEVFEFAYSKLSDDQKATFDEATKNIRKDDLGYLPKIDKMDELFGPELVTKSIDYINEKNIYNTEIRDILPEELLEKIPEGSDLSTYYKNIQEYMDRKIDVIIENNLTSRAKAVHDLYDLFNGLTKNQNSRTAKYYRDTVAMLPKNLDDRKMEQFLNNVTRFETRMQGLTMSYGIEEIGYNKERVEKVIKERLRFAKKENNFDYGMAKDDRHKRRERARTYRGIKLKIKAFPPKIKGIVEQIRPRRLNIFKIFSLDYAGFYSDKSLREKIADFIKNVTKEIGRKNKKQEPLTLAQKAELVKSRGLYINEEKFPEELKNNKKEPEIVNKKENIIDAPKPELVVNNVNQFEKISEKNNDLRWLCNLIDADYNKTNVDLGKHVVTLTDGKNELIFNYQTKKIEKNTFDKNENSLKSEDYSKIIKAVTPEQILKECEIKYYRENEGKDIYKTVKNIDLSNKEERLAAEKFIAKNLNMSFCKIDLKTGNITAHSISKNSTKIINFNINDTKAPIMDVLKPGGRKQYIIENNAVDSLISGFRDNEKLKNIELDKEDLENKIEKLSKIKDDNKNYKEPKVVAQAR